MNTIAHNRVANTVPASAWVALAAFGRRLGAVATELAQRRRRAAEQDRLWEAALADARQMADISRAMDRAAFRDPRYY